MPHTTGARLRVAHSAGDETGGNDGDCFQPDTAGQRADRRHCRASADERLERRRKLGSPEHVERRAAQAHRAPRAEEQRLDGRDRDTERAGDLFVRPALQLPHRERGPLIERQLAKFLEHGLHVRPLVIRHRDLFNRFVERNFLRSSRVPDETHHARVVGDRQKPRPGLQRLLPRLQRAERIHERRLRDVLRIRRVAQDGERVAIHVADVLFVETLERDLGALKKRSGHAPSG